MQSRPNLYHLSLQCRFFKGFLNVENSVEIVEYFWYMHIVIKFYVNLLLPRYIHLFPRRFSKKVCVFLFFALKKRGFCGIIE